MQLETIEIMALDHMLELPEQGAFEVIERSFTKRGFYSILRCENHPLPLRQESERVWQFTHPTLPDGGFFVCWPVCELTLCLEGVSNFGPWPFDYFPKALVEKAAGTS